MGFIKYSVIELGLDEDVPGWVKQSKVAQKSDEASATQLESDSEPANKNKEEQEEISTKDQ